MLKKAFLVLLFLSLSTVAYAIPVGPITAPCSGGGSIYITGDYNPLNGQFTLSLTATNCQESDETINGTAASNGTLQLATSSTATLNVTNFTFQFNVAGPDISGTQSCTGTLNGTYNLSTETFTGSETRTCNTTGSGQVSLVDILFGIEE